jgi:ferric-dicitrate binding protein FerR (iron transport regulator)
MLSIDQLESLAEKKLLGTINEQEQQLLQQWLDRQPGEQLDWHSDDTNEAALKKRLYERICKSADVSSKPRAISLLPTSWLRYAAAVIIVLGVASYIRWGGWNNADSSKLAERTGLGKSDDIVPAGTKAILTLASGKKIALDNSSSGQLIQPGGIELTTPKGGQYQVILPDGTKVWLNAVSSIKFPESFMNEKERKVTITGEVYFEVTHEARSAKKRLSPFLKGDIREAAGGYAAPHRPFIVSTPDGTQVQVLATSFNVNAYADEPAVKTTLLEGSVRINNQVLKPGQCYSNGKIITTDIEQDIAWKNGLFNFEGASLPEVMRQIARWYDVEIVYEGAIPTDKFVGKLPRAASIAQVLRSLQRMQVHFRVEGRKIIVTP